MKKGRGFLEESEFFPYEKIKVNTHGSWKRKILSMMKEGDFWGKIQIGRSILSSLQSHPDDGEFTAPIPTTILVSNTISLYQFVVFHVCSSCVSIGVFESGESVNSSGSSLFLSQPDWNMGFLMVLREPIMDLERVI